MVSLYFFPKLCISYRSELCIFYFYVYELKIYISGEQIHNCIKSEQCEVMGLKWNRPVLLTKYLIDVSWMLSSSPRCDSLLIRWLCTVWFISSASCGQACNRKIYTNLFSLSHFSPVWFAQLVMDFSSCSLCKWCLSMIPETHLIMGSVPFNVRKQRQHY